MSGNQGRNMIVLNQPATLWNRKVRLFSQPKFWWRKVQKAKSHLPIFLTVFFFMPLPSFILLLCFFYRLPNFPAFLSTQLFIAYSSYPIAFFVFTLHPFPLLSQFGSAFFLSTILKSAYLWLLILLFCSDNCKKNNNKRKQITVSSFEFHTMMWDLSSKFDGNKPGLQSVCFGKSWVVRWTVTAGDQIHY